MSKIVQAVNAMISNPGLVTDVRNINNEVFFVYKKKYVWSMRREDNEYFLWYYPDSTVQDLVNRAEAEYWDEVAMVVYKTSEIGTREARASFAELFTLLLESQYGMNDILNDIISDSDLF